MSTQYRTRYNSTFKASSKPMKRSAMKRVLNRIPGTGRKILRARGPSTADLKWAKAVRERDNYTCRWPGCGFYSQHIHAHHIHTRRQRPDLRHDPANGAALCNEHHDRLHHTEEGRREARELGLLGTETYEKARKEI